jgi:hypothetical protein
MLARTIESALAFILAILAIGVIVKELKVNPRNVYLNVILLIGSICCFFFNGYYIFVYIILGAKNLHW